MRRYESFCYINNCKFLILVYLSVDYQLLSPIFAKDYWTRNAGGIFPSIKPGSICEMKQSKTEVQE